MSAVDLLIGLLEKYSPTGQEAGAVAYLVEQMRDLEYTARIDAAGNAVGWRGEGPNEILMLGHIDTVPGVVPVRQEGERLYGRGSVDAKGPLACFTAAGAQVTPPPGWRVTVIGAVGEEGDSRGACFLRDRPAPVALVIGEPSKWDRITLGFKGSQWINYSTRRSMAHTAGQAESACEAAVRFWNAVMDWCSAYNLGITAQFNRLTPTLRGMQSETDGFSETAHLRIGMRLPPEVTLDQLKENLEKIKDEGSLSYEEGIEAYRAEKNTPLVRGLLTAIRKCGGQPAFSLKTGTSDMNILAPVWDCPTVAYGPGDSTLDHTPVEHILLDEYLRSIEVLVQALQLIMN